MSDYCALAEVKLYRGIAVANTDDDALLTELIPECSREVDDFCGRHFYGVYATRRFDAARDVDQRTLYLDDDLVGVTSLLNGDGSAIAASQYVLEPANVTPKHAITLKASGGVAWTYQTDPEQALVVTGTWGYLDGATPPPVVNRACIRLVAWRHAQRSAPFETQGFPEIGMVSVPTAMPADIQRMLVPYVRLRLMAIGGR
jgi:hypothetical protein